MVTDVMVINKVKLVPVKDNSNTVVVMAVVNQPLWNKQGEAGAGQGQFQYRGGYGR